MKALSSALGLAMKAAIALVILLLAVSLTRCFVVVKKHEVGRVYRFGRLRRELGPGQFAFVLPPPIDEFKAYSTMREKTIEIAAFLYAEPKQPNQPVSPTLRTGIDGYALTGDMNIVHCSATLSYRVVDPVRFHEMHQDPEGALRSVLRSSVVQAAGGMSAERSLFNAAELADRATARLKRTATFLDLGVSITRLVLRPRAPRQVKKSFDAQIVARNRADRAVREATAYRQTILNAAESKRDSILAIARVEKNVRVQTAEARLQTFSKLAEQYQINGDAMRRELRADSIRRVLERAEEVFLVDGREGRELRLQIGRFPKTKTETREDAEK